MAVFNSYISHSQREISVESSIFGSDLLNFTSETSTWPRTATLNPPSTTATRAAARMVTKIWPERGGPMSRPGGGFWRARGICSFWCSGDFPELGSRLELLRSFQPSKYSDTLILNTCTKTEDQTNTCLVCLWSQDKLIGFPSKVVWSSTKENQVNLVKLFELRKVCKFWVPRAT